MTKKAERSVVELEVRLFFWTALFLNWNIGQFSKIGKSQDVQVLVPCRYGILTVRYRTSTVPNKKIPKKEWGNLDKTDEKTFTVPGYWYRYRTGTETNVNLIQIDLDQCMKYSIYNRHL